MSRVKLVKDVNSNLVEGTVGEFVHCDDGKCTLARFDGYDGHDGGGDFVEECKEQCWWLCDGQFVFIDEQDEEERREVPGREVKGQQYQVFRTVVRMESDELRVTSYESSL